MHTKKMSSGCILSIANSYFNRSQTPITKNNNKHFYIRRYLFLWCNINVYFLFVTLDVSASERRSTAAAPAGGAVALHQPCWERSSRRNKWRLSSAQQLI